eukprot:SAG22_NODE_834_length_6927_cov_7.202402_4_plen_469_part_00
MHDDMTARRRLRPLWLAFLLAQSAAGDEGADLRCGVDWGDANGKCGDPCPDNTSEECPHGEDCWSELSSRACDAAANPGPAPPAEQGLAQRCGVDWDDANSKCGALCPHDSSEECPHGEDCFSELDAPGACHDRHDDSDGAGSDAGGSTAQRCTVDDLVDGAHRVTRQCCGPAGSAYECADQDGALPSQCSAVCAPVFAAFYTRWSAIAGCRSLLEGVSADAFADLCRQQTLQSADQRCGVDWDDANGKCGDPCPENSSEECPHGEDCWSELDAPGACAAEAVAAADRCLGAVQETCTTEGRQHDECSACSGQRPRKVPECRGNPEVLSRYCQPVRCEWWQDRHFSELQVVQAYRHFSYAGVCAPRDSPCAGSSIRGTTMNNALPTSTPICDAPGFDCCVPTFPDEPLVPRSGPTLQTPIVKRPNCAVMDTDGARPPYGAAGTPQAAFRLQLVTSAFLSSRVSSLPCA